jgi:hypothetical protein
MSGAIVGAAMKLTEDVLAAFEDRDITWLLGALVAPEEYPEGEPELIREAVLAVLMDEADG